MTESKLEVRRVLTLVVTAVAAVVLVGCPSAGAGGGDGGGGSSTTPVEIVGFSVGEGDPPAINTTDVVLHMDVSGAVEMRFLEGDGGSFDGIDWQPYSDSYTFTLSSGDGIKTVRAQFRNDAGEVKTAEDEITLSTSGPTVNTFSIENGDAYTSSRSVSISIDVSDASEMRLGNEEESGSVDWESGWQSAGSNSRSWTLDDGDGEKTVRAAFRDVAGNETEVTDTIVLDTRAPSVTSFSINGGASETASAAVTLDSSVSDGTSGVAEARFREDGSAWSDWTTYSNSVDWTLSGGEGSHTVEAEFRDEAGNTTYGESDSITYRIVPSVGSVVIKNQSGWEGQTDDNVVEIHTQNAQNVQEMRLREPAQTWSEGTGWQSYSAIRTYELSPGAGTKTVEAQYRRGTDTTAVFSDSIEYRPSYRNLGYDEIKAAVKNQDELNLGFARDDASWALPTGTIVLFENNSDNHGNPTVGKMSITNQNYLGGGEIEITVQYKIYGENASGDFVSYTYTGYILREWHYYDLWMRNEWDQSRESTDLYLNRGVAFSRYYDYDLMASDGVKLTVYHEP